MSSHLLHLALVACGGAIGGMLRFGLSAAIARRFGEAFPLGTLAVNASGAFAIGVLAAVLISPDTRPLAQSSAWVFFAIGVLGSYTTVSSFSLQTLVLAQAGEPGRALANVAGSLVLCLGGAAAGFYAARLLAG